MREIEVKAKLKNKGEFFLKAKELGITFGPTIEQDDSTYESFRRKDDPSWTIFRIRKQKNKTMLTMKYKASTRSRDHHERESSIDNPREVADMLERLGYTFGVRTKKTRQVAKYKHYEICIDEIDGLGCFVEIEELAEDDADVDKVQNNLWTILQQLGVSKDDRVHKGYDDLMHEFLASEN